MKYALTFIAGIWIGLAFSRIPHYPLFRDLPVTPVDWVGPKMTGSWSEDDRVVVSRYYNGGK